MKQEAAFFDGKEPVLIYIAKRLSDALKLESLLTEAGLDYGVEADEYRGGIIFATTRAGAFFYVLPESDVRRARSHAPRRLQAIRRRAFAETVKLVWRGLSSLQCRESSGHFFPETRHECEVGTQNACATA